MQKILAALFLVLTSTYTLPIEECSLFGISGSATITQQICDDLVVLESARILNPTNTETEKCRKEVEALAREHCINTDYPLSLDELITARNNAKKELVKIEPYNNAKPDSYTSQVTSYKRAIDAYDKAIQEFFDRKKAPQTCCAFFTHSINRTRTFITTKVAQSDLINNAPARIQNKCKDSQIKDTILNVIEQYQKYNMYMVRVQE